MRINVEDHIGLVYKVASKYKGITFMDFEDIVGYGMIGLVEAGKNFDENRGVKFSSYACLVINNKILTTFRDDKNRMGSAKDRLNGNAQCPINFSSLIVKDKDGNEDEIEYAIIEDFSEKLIDKICIQNELNKLEKRELTVVKNYYIQDKTQVQIAKELNTSQSQINRIIKRSSLRVKNSFLGELVNEQISTVRI